MGMGRPLKNWNQKKAGIQPAARGETRARLPLPNGLCHNRSGCHSPEWWRKELNAIGVNFNQAVHRLHTLDHVPQMQIWLLAFDRDKQVLFAKMDEIKTRINLISDQWLQ
jgi:hypothetical protein